MIPYQTAVGVHSLFDDVLEPRVIINALVSTDVVLTDLLTLF